MQTIHLDISNMGIIPTIYSKQGDVGRKFRAVITDNGEAYHIPADALLSVWYSGTSGEGNYSMVGENSAFSIDGNTVTVELVTQMVTNPGGGNACLVMNRKDGTQIGTWNIPYSVEKIPGIGSSEAEQYFTALSEVAGKAAESAAKATEAAATFETDRSLSVAGKAADAAATGDALAGKAPVALGAPHNYLDNSDFRNPVNQRGETSYTAGGYTIDRWKTPSVDLQVSLSNSKLVITNLNAENRYALHQYIEDNRIQSGKVYTLAVKTEDGNVYCGTVEALSDTFTSEKIACGDVGDIQLSKDDTGYRFDFNINAQSSVGILWAALYEGEYTINTLPTYKTKGYAVELLECQRYFNKYSAGVVNIGFGCSLNSGTSAAISIITPIEMRTTPSITVSTLGYIRGSGSSLSVSELTVAYKSNNIVCLNAVVSSIPVGMNASLINADFTLSADL